MCIRDRIIPKRHVADYFELKFEEQKDLVQLAGYIQKSLKVNFQPDGFNVWINIGKSAGQKFPHTVLHLIPRYEGDSKNSNSGIRNVLK